MKRIDVLVIGGGQAGLAMSHELDAFGIEHVVLERGRVAERWRSERWESLRLLSPNWLTRLPGYRYSGPDPDGFMTKDELVRYLERYAGSFRAPVLTGVTVESVRRSDCCGYRVSTNAGEWTARAVVIATGQNDRPIVPAFAKFLPADVMQITPDRYRQPAQLPDGGVLVVGASATGVQLADELQASGRAVTLAVGRHTRLPRRYRGRDITWWMDRMGLFDETPADVKDPEASRRQPSMQLVGRPDHATLGLIELAARGVRLTGRAVDAGGGQVRLGDDLVAQTAAADIKLIGLLARIDRFIEAPDAEARAGEPLAATGPEPFVSSWPLAAEADTPPSLNLRAEGIRSIVWATGFEPNFSWLGVPVLDGAGRIRHVGGVTPAPGLLVLGLPFLRRRKSAFIDGVGDDARALAEHLAERFATLAQAV